MMPLNIILSFLGTGDYQETTYEWKSKRLKTIFFAEALCDFFPNHQLNLVMTQEAHNKHGENLSRVCNYKDIHIPSGKVEAELWEMFEIIEKSIPENTTLVVDITHGFRSQPILILAICVYLQTVKNVTVERIVYGAFEAKTDQNITPIFDLTSFLNLIDWSTSAQQFFQYGNAAPMRDLLKDIHTQTHKSQKEYKAHGLATIGERLTDISDAFAMIRPGEVIEKAKQIPKAFEKAREDLSNLTETRPFSLLLEKINARIKPFVHAQDNLFSPEGFGIQAEMIGLYLRIEQYAQAITLARESLVSHVCMKDGFDPINERKKGEDILSGLRHDLKDSIKLDEKEKNLIQLWDNISNLRNDINHAGMRPNPIPAKTALKNIKSECEKVIQWLKQPM